MATYCNPPTNCDICREKIDKQFVDGKTRQGPWGNMCPACFGIHGISLGTGLGQLYEKKGDQFEKIAG